jgi:hypothetical protein
MSHDAAPRSALWTNGGRRTPRNVWADVVRNARLHAEYRTAKGADRG